MKNKIVIVGDSHTFGHGCADRVWYYDNKLKVWVGDPTVMTLLQFNETTPSIHCWASLAQADFPEFEFQNLAQSGNSNDNMFMQLADRIDKSVVLVIFNGTFTDRLLVKDPLNIKDQSLIPYQVGQHSRPTNFLPKSFLAASEDYTKHIYTDAIGENQTVMSILSSHTLSGLNGAKFAWSIPHRLNATLTGALRPLGCLRTTRVHSIQTFPFVQYSGGVIGDYTAIDGHSNELAHKIYYKNIIKPLLTRLLK